MSVAAVSKSDKTELLRKFIAEQIAKEPFEYDGAVWIRVHLEPVAEHLGFSLRTLKDMLKKPPFRLLVKRINGQRCSLLREGGDPTMAEHQRDLLLLWKRELQDYNRRLQKTYAAEAASLTLQISEMEAKLADSSLPKAVREALESDVKTFKPRRDKFIKRAEEAAIDAAKLPEVPKKQYGCLKGLLDDWGPGSAPHLLRFVIRNWPEFKVAVGLYLAELEALGQLVEYTFHDYPSLTVIRRFWTVALDLFLFNEQMAGKVAPQTSNEFLAMIKAMKAKDAAKFPTS